MILKYRLLREDSMWYNLPHLPGFGNLLAMTKRPLVGDNTYRWSELP